MTETYTETRTQVTMRLVNKAYIEVTSWQHVSNKMFFDISVGSGEQKMEVTLNLAEMVALSSVIMGAISGVKE